MKAELKAGTTSYVCEIFIQDSSSTTGSGRTGLAYNTSGLTAYYKRSNGTAAAQITLADIATLGTFASGGFKEVDATNMPGVYEIHIPDACLAAGATSVAILLKGATNMAPLPIEITLKSNDEADIYSRLGAPAGASIAADIATRLATSGYTAPDNASITAIKAKTDNLPASPAATGDQMALTESAIDNIFDEAYEGAETLRQLLRLLRAPLLGKSTGGGTGTRTFRNAADTKARVTATVDANGNRTSVTVDAT